MDQELVKAKKRQWYWDNREKSLAQSQKWRAEHPERVKELNQQWRKQNPDRAKELDRKHGAGRYARDPEGSKARIRKHIESDPQGYKAKRTSAQMRYRHGISHADKAALLAAQGGACAVCASLTPGGKNWHTDHCHETGKIRGVLCHHCNIALGHAKDSPATLRKLAAYLEEHAQ